jgi:hypothetical protein
MSSVEIMNYQRYKSDCAPRGVNVDIHRRHETRHPPLGAFNRRYGPSWENP